MIDVVYEDTELLSVNKPAGLLVHRSAIAADEKVLLLDQVRQQVGAPVFLAHRLDRATSGVLLLAKSREIAGELGKQFMARGVEKYYLAVVRGWPEAEGTIDYTSHGRGDHNQLWRIHFGVHRLLLHAWWLTISHPLSGVMLHLQAAPDAEWNRVLARLGWESALAAADAACC